MADFSVTGYGLPTGQPLWLRKCQLTIATGRQTFDFSHLRIRFRVRSRTVQTLKQAEITVYNLSPSHANAIFSSQQAGNPSAPEFSQVALAAGYQDGPFANIFTGQIAYLRMGKEDAVTRYLTIVASDCDAAYNWATINVTLEANCTPQNQLDAILKVLKPYGVTAGYIPELPKTPLPRGKILQGMVRDILTDLARSVGCDWHFVSDPSGGSKLNFVSRDVPMTGDVITLDPQHGLIGAPEQTLDGLSARSLLNPYVVTGRLIQVPTSLITLAGYTGSPLPNTNQARPVQPGLSTNSIYMVYSLLHAGDSRGQEWYSDLIAVASDASAQPISSTFIQAVVDGA
jgi:hypothetical protein